MTTLAHDFAAYTQWRTGLSEQIERFRKWLTDNDLSDAQTDQHLVQLIDKLHEDRLTVAFVAEFSRGKSELINAIFFAGFGNRMLPSSAGRTTMCPTELLFEESKLPCIELLPIRTRTSNAGITEYKKFPEEWTILPLAIDSPERLQQTLRHVSEVTRVSPEEARGLGFAVGSNDDEEGFRIGDDGLVEVPKWRHAMINFPHPLLKQGLIILDTPGLNAIGTEPELTLSLLPNAHAVLFILAADTGVTQSDLDIWKEHIGTPEGRKKGRIVVLNKIDGLWDELKSGDEIEAEISKQVASCASTLALPESQVFPVSAQKALVAKINGDRPLLARSRLLELESALSGEVVPAKQEIVRDATAAEFNEVFSRIRNILDARVADLRDQLKELSDLRGKNRGVVEYMMGKVRNEKQEFESGLQRYYAVRSVFTNMTNNLFAHLGLDSLRTTTQKTRDAMQESAFSKGLSDAMTGFFAQMRDNLSLAEKEVAEILEMMTAIYKKFSVEHGLNLGTPTSFSLLRYQKEIERMEKWCNENLNTPMNLLTNQKRVITQRFFEEIAVQARRAFEHANKDAEIWLKAVMAPMETQVREHQILLKRRLESIKRIHQATDTLEERISELSHAEKSLATQISGLEQVGAGTRALLSARLAEPVAAAA